MIAWIIDCGLTSCGPSYCSWPYKPILPVSNSQLDSHHHPKVCTFGLYLEIPGSRTCTLPPPHTQLYYYVCCAILQRCPSASEFPGCPTATESTRRSRRPVVTPSFAVQTFSVSRFAAFTSIRVSSNFPIIQLTR